jgi:hypothetical protein
MSIAGEPITDDLFAHLGDEVRRLAGLLLFVAPGSAFLGAVAQPFAADAGDPTRLRARLAEEDRRLEQQLAALAPSFPLARLVTHHRLSRLESDLLFMALLPELDDRFGEVFLIANAGLPSRRPTLGLALRALLPNPPDRWHARRHLAGSALWSAGILLRDGDDRPGLDAALIPSAPAVSAAHGDLPERLEGGVDVETLTSSSTRPALRPGIAATARDLIRWIELVGAGVAHVVAEAAEDARAIAGEVAAAFDRPLVRVARLGPDPARTLREAALCGEITSGLVLVEIEPGSPPLRLPAAWSLAVPVILAGPPGLEIELPLALPSRRAFVPRPRPEEQSEAWRRALGPAAASVRVDLLASRTHLTVSQIGTVAAIAALGARTEGRAEITHTDVIAALGEAVPDPVSSLARASRPRVEWSKLVVDRETRASIDDLVVRVEHRVTVQDRWGMAGAEGRGEGLVALFHGDSGTGKTLAAEAIATRLGMPMLRIDLSRVVSKYIGETEKHLGALFDMAEGFRTVLFFDEADALFGNRTGVKDSHDRYANLETNYLLARLEAFEGIAVLATNLLRNIDDAFTRRLQLILHFPRPTPSLQQKLWTLHLPREQLAPDVDLELITRQYDLVGGEIRNAALTAAYAAAAAGSSITAALLEQGVRAERLKRGKAVRRGGDS